MLGATVPPTTQLPECSFRDGNGPVFLEHSELSPLTTCFENERLMSVLLVMQAMHPLSILVLHVLEFC